MKILIAEDDFVCRTIAGNMLSKVGTCHFAVNGQEAVSAFTQAWQSGQPYRLACLDIRMPVMDGLSALREIRRLELERGIRGEQIIKVIVVSSIDEIDTIFASFRHQNDVYFLKPLDEIKLAKKLMEMGLITKEVETVMIQKPHAS